MIYSIAGLSVEIYGDSRMNESEVVFVKESEDSPYIRQSENLSDNDAYSLPSGEFISPGGICNSNDENEEFSSFAGKILKAKINGCPADDMGNSLYVLHRLSNYRAGAAQGVLAPDFRIYYKVLPIVSMPCGEYAGEMRGFSVYRGDNGFSLIKTIPQIDEVLVKMEFNAEFNSASIEIFDVYGLGGLPLQERIHSYIGEAFAYLALKHKRVVFHSSAISCNNSGVCFSAPSGTGKSTHTGLWKTHYGELTEIINDDTPVLYINSESTVLCGSPWSGKTELNINKEVPLKGIVFLERSIDNRIEKLSGIIALKRFFAEAKIPQIPGVFNMGVDLAGEILQKVPAYLLGCNISKDAVDLVKNTLKI
ncbi:MAG: hypothetical protein IJN39_03050 [Clostridia bacterium]|nr:hypothetical protein [Clostridia bacterium]